MKIKIMIFMVLSLFCIVLVGCSSKNVDSCTQKLEAEGNCKMLIHGYEYDLVSGTCHEVTMGGCSGISPFNSLDACKSACEKEYNSQSWKEIIPDSCKKFSDGCNTCSRVKGEDLALCTEMDCGGKYKIPTCLD